MFLLPWLGLCKHHLLKRTCTWRGQFSTNEWEISRKVISSKDASVKTKYLKMLRTVLLNILWWIVTKIVTKSRHKRIKRFHVFKTCFFLSFLMRTVSPVPDLWLFFEDCFKRSNKAGSGDFYKYSMESIKGILMMVCYKDHKPDS